MTVSENEDREYRSTLVKIGKKGEEPVKQIWVNVASIEIRWVERVIYRNKDRQMSYIEGTDYCSFCILLLKI